MSPTRTRRVCPPRYANRLFCLTAGAYIAGLFGRMSYAAVMADLIAQEGLGKSQAGLIGTMFFVVYGVCQLLSGFLGDRISPKKLIFTGIIGSAVLNLGMGLSGASYPVMLSLWTLNGVFQSMLWSPAARVFSEMIPPTHRKRACANGAATYPIATILTYLFASALLHFTGWRVDFLLSSLIMLISAAFFWVRMSFYERETEQRGEIEEITLTQVENAAQGSLIRTLIVSGTLLTVLGAVSLGLLRDGIQSWMPTYLDECFSLGASLSVALSIVLPVFNLIGVYLSKWIAGRFIRNELAGTACFMAVAGGALAVLCLTGMDNAVVSLALMTLSSTALVGANLMIINLMPIHFGAIGRASSVTGIFNSACYLGSALSSYGIGFFSERWGWTAAMAFLLVFAVITLLTSLSGIRRWGKYRRNI